MAGRKLWSKKEINFLKREYAHMKNKDRGKALGRSISSINNKAFESEIKKDVSECVDIISTLLTKI